jgi:hypothetical protein
VNVGFREGNSVQEGPLRVDSVESPGCSGPEALIQSSL